MTVAPAIIRAALLDQAARRGPDKTLCPSEVARALSPDHWRDLMAAVRQVGIELVAEGRLVATQKGQVIDPETAQGPIRYRQV